MRFAKAMTLAVKWGWRADNPCKGIDRNPEERRERYLSPAEIGFVRQRPVPWLNPCLLAGTAVRVLLAHLFGGYLDKRLAAEPA